MKRVQLIIGDSQLEWLAAESERTSASMSVRLRALMTEVIEHRHMDEMADNSLWGIIGMASGPKDGNLAHLHPQPRQGLALYGLRLPGPCTGS